MKKVSISEKLHDLRVYGRPREWVIDTFNRDPKAIELALNEAQLALESGNSGNANQMINQAKLMLKVQREEKILAEYNKTCTMAA